MVEDFACELPLYREKPGRLKRFGRYKCFGRFDRELDICKKCVDAYFCYKKKVEE